MVVSRFTTFTENSADVPLSLCVLLSQQSHVFLSCLVLTDNDSRKDLYKICQSLWIVSVNDFELPIWLLELLQAPLSFLRSFCFARVWLYPLGGQVLHHYSVSMIVSRFTTFTETFVIRWNQITKIFRSRHDCTSAFSARSPGNLGSQADIAMWVLWKVRMYTVLTRSRFHFWLGSVLTSLLWVSKALLMYFHQRKSLWNPASLASHATDRFVLLRVLHFYFCSRFLWFHAAGLPEALHSYLYFFLVLDLLAPRQSSGLSCSTCALMLSFLQLYCLIGKRIECNFFRFFELHRLLVPPVLLWIGLVHSIHWWVGRKLLLSASVNVKIFLVSFHASPRAHRTCLSVSSLRSVLKFHGVGTALMRTFDL